MNTRVLMIASAAAMGFAGVALTFAPQEVLAWAGVEPHGFAVLVAQAAGALYVGFAMLNWMAKDVAIGGIYSRPVTVGNFAHFCVMGGALVRVAVSSQRNGFILLVALLYLVFAIGFGLLLFISPRSVAKTE
jgi:hypothetical protein